jgi:glycosyltransferase involved in cell wall biosynthesis
MTSTPLFTAIVHTYYRPALLKQAVEALQRQTYGNLEIILINNGATPETVAYLHQAASEDPRVKLVEFSENQFSWDDPLQYVHICLNAALTEATGDYVWVQEDDDFLADDYAEKMAGLFQGNPECTTAAGLPVSIDINGHLNPDQYEAANTRDRYMSGRVLAEDCMSRRGKMFATPGSIFTIKRDVLIQAGGYHRGLELSHLYGIVPFGVTGFDSTALFYWRHHEGQLNLQASGSGWIGIDENLSLITDWRLKERWSVFGNGIAQRVVGAMARQVYDRAASRFVFYIYGLKTSPALRILAKMWFRPFFWYRVIVCGMQKQYYVRPALALSKPFVKAAFRLWPGLAGMSPFMGKLRELVTREPA